MTPWYVECWSPEFPCSSEGWPAIGSRLCGPCDWCEEEFSQPAGGTVEPYCPECYFEVELGWELSELEDLWDADTGDDL